VPYDFKDYKQIGLTRTEHQIARALEKFNIDDLEQIGDIGTAFIRAKELRSEYQTEVQRFADRVGCPNFSCRPGSGVKHAERILEKLAANGGEKPLDILAGKLVTDSLKEMYAIARRIPEHFTVVMFKDRMVQSQESGYRDLQCLLNFNGHIVELKVCHSAFDEADAIEHRVYEIIRSMRSVNPTSSEIFVKQELFELQQKLYTRVWKAVLAQEVSA
jgi:hypothetical protein